MAPPAAVQPVAPSVPAPGAGSVVLPETLQEIRALLGEASREWSGIVEAMAELREALSRDAESGLKPPAVPASAPPQVERKHPEARASTKAPPAPNAASAAPRAPEARAPSPPSVSLGAPEPAPGAALPAPGPQPEIDAKLGEVLKLLKENIARRQGEAPATVEIPRNLTLEIAREVAGKVKESVLSSLRTSPAPAANSTEASAPSGPAQAPPAPKRIPLDDLSAIIDSLTKGQG